MSGRVTALDVHCAACGADPGQRCHRLDGLRIRVNGQWLSNDDCRPHEPRCRRAREENARLHPEHVHGQMPLWGRA